MIIDEQVNSASSSYHFMNSAFFREESIFNFKTNCPDTFRFLNSNDTLVDAEDNTLITRKEVVVDLSCAKTLLCKSNLIYKYKLSFLDMGTAVCPFCHPDCQQTTVELRHPETPNSTEFIPVTFFHTLLLSDPINQHWTQSILSIPLVSLQLDWPLHGAKAMTNNFLMRYFAHSRVQIRLFRISRNVVRIFLTSSLDW